MAEQRSRSAVVGGFEIAEVTFAGNDRLRRHDHEEPSLVLLFEGAFRGVARRDDYQMESGDWAVVPSATNHEGSIGPAGSRAILVKATGGDRRGLTAWLGRVEPLRGATAGRLARRIDRELGRRDPPSRFALEAAVLDLYGRAFERRERPAPNVAWVDRVRDRLAESVASPPSSAELALEAGVSRSRLHRTFRHRFGCSIGDWLRARRLELAAQLLRIDDRPLARVAHETGYYDQSHLTNDFKRHYGLTPSVYRHARRSSVSRT